MRSKVFGALLSLMTGLACAESEWVWYGRTQESNFYYDTVNIRQAVGFPNRTQHLWRAWTIEDQERPTMVGARSELSLYEYDCSTNRFRVVQQELYSDAMAGGRRLDRITRPSDWIGVIPNTAPKLLGDIVCEDFQGAK
jgi:hypothetical protein